MTSSPGQSSALLRFGLCLTAMGTVLLELILTRLFSVTAGYHFAFMIVSITMFGMTLGALVTLARAAPNTASVLKMLVTNAISFAISTVAVFGIYNTINQSLLQLAQQQGLPFLWIVATFVLFSIPFYFSGVCICLCLSRFEGVGKLYAADLIGAGLSCILLVVGLTIADAQNVLICGGLLGAFGAICFSLHAKNLMNAGAMEADTPAGAKQIRSAPARNEPPLVNTVCGAPLIPPIIAAVLCALALFLLPPQKVNVNVDEPIEYVKWSPVGRVVVTAFKKPAVSWAKVPVSNPPAVDQKGLYIDFGAFTVMTGGSANKEQLEPIKRDVTAVGNALRPGSSAFIIGVGGGRDILTSLLFGQRTIDGIEVNPAIVDMLTKRYADFSGHLKEKPGISIVNDEARSWLAQSGKKYGLVQCSLVDTWAASSSGAFMLTENVLYTKEAFEVYLSHLEPNGVLSFLRWGDEHEPGQIMRMLNLARHALSNAGIKNFANHVILIGAKYRDWDSPKCKFTIGDMLVSPQPFSNGDIERIQKLAQEEGYELFWLPPIPGRSPEVAKEPFASFIKNTSKVNPGMPSDDCPFFFTPVRPSDNESSMAEPAQGRGLALLLFTFLLSFVLVLLTIVVPAWSKLKSKIGSAKDIAVSASFFACLGIGFMQVEVGQIERLTVLLGNPTYSLSVVLFALLLSSGIGSYLVEVLLIRGSNAGKLVRRGLIASCLLVAASALLSLCCSSMVFAAPTGLRIVVAILLVSIPAFFMGWAFPLGMTIFTKRNPDGGAWFWAVNGATSVLGSVLAAILSVMMGITVTLMTGAFLYLVAWAVMLLPVASENSAAAET